MILYWNTATVGTATFDVGKYLSKFPKDKMWGAFALGLVRVMDCKYS